MLTTKKQVVEVLSHIPKGNERRLFLEQTNACDFLMSIGSNVTLFYGQSSDDTDILKRLSTVDVFLIQRRTENGVFDGFGAFGGLSECLDENLFIGMSLSERETMVGVWDNVIMQNGQPVLTQDKHIISLNNVRREMREELSDIGFYDIAFEWDKMIKTPLVCLDDDYLVHRWEPGTPARIVEPQCYVMPISSSLADTLMHSDLKKTRQPNGELFGLVKMPLNEALFQIAPLTTQGYHYSHEWLSAWFLASFCLQEEYQRQQLVDLLKQVPSFEGICRKIRVPMNDVCHLLLSGQNATHLSIHKTTCQHFVRHIQTEVDRINNP